MTVHYCSNCHLEPRKTCATHTQSTWGVKLCSNVLPPTAANPNLFGTEVLNCIRLWLTDLPSYFTSNPQKRLNHIVWDILDSLYCNMLHTLMLTGMRRSSRNCGSLENSTCTMSLRQCSADRRRSSKHTNTKDDHQYRNCSMEPCKQHNLKVQKGYSGMIQITEHNGKARTICFIFCMSWVKISA